MMEQTQKCFTSDTKKLLDFERNRTRNFHTKPCNYLKNVFLLLFCCLAHMSFVGFDCSTQSFSVVVINEDLEILYEKQLDFDKYLPQYGTTNGSLVIPQNGKEIVCSPTMMWIESLFLLFDKMKEDGIKFNNIKAISSSAQQHATVYWKKDICPDALFTTPLPLPDDIFSVPLSPIWRDSSTTEECQKLLEVKNALWWRKTTGSLPYERFSGPQIAKIISTKPSQYEDTGRISLASSCLASILLGEFASIDYSDGSGMNLLDLSTLDWSEEALKLISNMGKDYPTSEKVTKLRKLLGQPTPPWSVLGTVHRYFVDRYSFSDSCKVIACSGDNPCSLVGCGLQEGDCIVSLGTSSTFMSCGIDLEHCISVQTTKTMEDGHLFVDPITAKSFMGLLCFKNGSLARERVRNEYSKETTWESFNDDLEQTEPGNKGNFAFYFYEPEITPRVRSGIHRFDSNGKIRDSPFDVPAMEVRAIVESQFMSMRIHAQNIGMYPLKNESSRIIATGGSSSNKKILQILADIFGYEVYCLTHHGSAALGAAYRAYNGLCLEAGKSVPQVHTEVLVCTPNKEVHKIYNNLEKTFIDCEAFLNHK